MNKDTICTVTNRSSGMVIYRVPEMNVRRVFNLHETKEVPFGELFAVAQQPGGRELLYGYLLIKDVQAAKELMNIDLKSEVEYNMTEDEVKTWMHTSSLDAFKDALDFAPEGVKDLMKRFAIELPLNDVEKREAMKKQLNFDVDKAIEIKREAEAPEKGEPAPEKPQTIRRVAATGSNERRVKIIGQKES